MKRIAWLTDLHLSFVPPENRQAFVDEVSAAGADALLIGGDVGEAKNVVRFLENLASQFELPTYCVLGNHDFYEGGIASVRDAVRMACRSNPYLHYLTTTTQPVPLKERVALVGHDGWADAREGDYHRSLVMMNDYRLISELAEFTKQQRLYELHRLGDEAAAHIREQLNLALPENDHVFVLTHVPPFRQACWYQGAISDDEWAPHFVCQAMGRAILDMARLHPDKRLTVLCGHTHSPGVCQPADNVRVITGGAEYGNPRITRLFELD